MKLAAAVLVASFVGTTAAYGASARVVTATQTVQPGQKGHVVARCPSGMHATGGGFRTTGVAANDSYPLVVAGVAKGWVLTTHKPKAPTGGTATAGKATVYAICER